MREKKGRRLWGKLAHNIYFLQSIICGALMEPNGFAHPQCELRKIMPDSGKRLAKALFKRWLPIIVLSLRMAGSQLFMKVNPSQSLGRNWALKILPRSLTACQG